MPGKFKGHIRANSLPLPSGGDTARYIRVSHRHFGRGYPETPPPGETETDSPGGRSFFASRKVPISKGCGGSGVSGGKLQGFSLPPEEFHRDPKLYGGIEAKVGTLGKSLIVRIPADVREYLKLGKGDKLVFTTDGKKLVLEKS